ncbi:DJ-1/PfpI family protein [Streptomyces sp. R-74717]|uniref:GlxA family transcriptional regulator n=1 Tax=Streptomyces sp. R-74717 TaxID=2969820 RepID=UPI0039B55166
MTHSHAGGQRHVVVIPLFDGVRSLTFSGPADVLAGASREDFRYDVLTASHGGVPVRSSNGLVFLPDTSLADVADVDTVILPGADGIPLVGPEAAAAINGLVTRARRLVSVCTGAFLLAGTGLLDGRTVATHWQYADELARRHPEVKADARDFVLRDGPVTTAGGVASGIELGLALVEQDLGRETAQRLARHLVTYLSRPGGQAQFAELRAREARSPALREVQRLVLDFPEGDLTLRTLSQHAGLSERRLSQLFREQVGMSVKEFVEQVRVAFASRLLTETADSQEAIARQAGFGTEATLRHAFLRVLRVSPREYRERFT